MPKFLILFFIAVCLCPVLSAKEIAVGSQGVSPFLDTEISTNVFFNVSRNDVKVFDVRIELASSVSNCVQVAFGCDANGDGEVTRCPVLCKNKLFNPRFGSWMTRIAA